MKKNLRRSCKQAYKFYLNLADLKENIKESNDVTKSTMSIASFNYFLEKYKKNLADAYISLKGKTATKKAQKILKLIENISDEIRNLLAQNLFRIFIAKKNVHFQPKTLQEIPEVVEKVEKSFEEEVNTAVDFFGQAFLNFRFQKLGVMARQLPKNIREMLDSSDRKNWQKHDYLNGCPQPLYLEMYNNTLRDFSYWYLSQQEKSIKN